MMLEVIPFPVMMIADYVPMMLLVRPFLLVMTTDFVPMAVQLMVVMMPQMLALMECILIVLECVVVVRDMMNILQMVIVMHLGELRKDITAMQDQIFQQLRHLDGLLVPVVI